MVCKVFWFRARGASTGGRERDAATKNSRLRGLLSPAATLSPPHTHPDLMDPVLTNGTRSRCQTVSIGKYGLEREEKISEEWKGCSQDPCLEPRQGKDGAWGGRERGRGRKEGNQVRDTAAPSPDPCHAVALKDD